MDSAMFNTSDTNYSELDPKSDLGNAANQAIADVVKANNEQYRRNAQMAVDLANQKSQNFQKLGTLVKSIGEFTEQARQWNDAREQLAAREQEVKDAKEASKKQNEKLYNEAVEKSESLFNYKENNKVPFYTDKNLDLTEQKYVELAKESNAAYKEGVNLAFEADRDYKLTDNIDNAEFGIKLFQAASVADYQSRGAALTSEVAKGYEGYMASVQDIKVPTEFGMLSIQDAIQSKDPARYDAVIKFHRGAYYWQAGVFGGKNALSKRQQLALLKLTDDTDKIQRSAFIKDTYEQAKADYDLARQTDLADAIKGSDNVTEIFFGSPDDPNSGYIAKFEKISGKKDVAGAIALLEKDLRKLAEDGSLNSDDLARIVNMKGIKARDGSGTKTLKEFNEALHSRLEGLLGSVAEKEQKQKTSKDVQNIRNIVEAATERLNKISTGAEEVHLEAEVKQAKKQIRDLGLDVSEGSIYNKYFTPLLSYYTKDDARDEATVSLVKNAVDNGYFKNAENLIKTINDPTFKKEADDYYKARDPIMNNKDAYDKTKKELNALIEKGIGLTSTTQAGQLKSVIVKNNAGENFDDIFLEAVRQKVAVKTALTTAYEKVKTNLEKDPVIDKKSKTNTTFGDYYVTGDGRGFDRIKGGGYAYQQAVNASFASQALANPDTKNEWLNKETAHDGEPVNELVRYANGGPIPLYYIEASKHLRFTTAADLIHARLGALGYDVEQKLLVDGGYLKKELANARLTKMLSYMPSATKANRVMFEMQGDQEQEVGGSFGKFFDNFVRKTRNLKFGNKSDTNKAKLDFENIPINDTLTQSIKYGYGANGFGQYKISPLIIGDPEIERLSGLDYSVDPLTVENQQRIIRAKNIKDGIVNNAFSTGFTSMPNLNDLDMEGVYDGDTNIHNQAFLLDPNLLDTYFMEMF